MMPDYLRSPQQIWITRGHLAALAVATAAIAALAFMVGLELGRSRSGQPPTEADPADVAFLPDATDEETLEALLREVEQAQAELEHEAAEERNAGGSSFAKELAGDGAPSAPPPRPPAEDISTLPARSDDAPVAPSTPVSEGAPNSGWAVQVAAYSDQSEADAQVQRLLAQGFAAYRTAALVAGQTWHRVRIGGYETRQDAEAARDTLEEQLGVQELLVAHAP